MADVVVTEKHFREWEQEAFGYGYGTGETYILPALHAFFLHLEDGHAYTAATMEEGLGGTAAWLLINVLCRTQMLDYGTSPRFGWLTRQGQRLRDYVLSKTPEELYEIVTQDMDPAQPLCSRTFCHCEDGMETAGCRHNPLFHAHVLAVIGGFGG